MSPSGHTEFLYYTNCDRVKDQWRDNQGNKNCKLGVDTFLLSQVHSMSQITLMLLLSICSTALDAEKNVVDID